MFLCIIASIVIWSVFVSWGTAKQAVPSAVVLLFVYGTLARARLRWPIRDFLVSYVAVVATLLWAISYISGLGGAYLFCSVNLEWLAICGSVIGVPWFSGFAIGSQILRRRERRKIAENTDGVKHP